MSADNHLSLEDNIFLAKRNLVDSIWKEARLEGIAVTYPQTADVLEGRVVPDLSLEQNLALNNLKQAWRYVLDEPHPIDFDALTHLNLLIGQGGVVRYAGKGILAVPIDLQGEFFNLLIAFYESNRPDALIAFLQAHCIEKPTIGKRPL